MPSEDVPRLFVGGVLHGVVKPAPADARHASALSSRRANGLDVAVDEYRLLTVGIPQTQTKVRAFVLYPLCPGVGPPGRDPIDLVLDAAFRALGLAVEVTESNHV